MDDRFVQNQQVAALRAQALRQQEQSGVSLWLYIAGLCVTLSGLYAVNYSLEDANFANCTYALALVGYAFSYTVRVRQVDLNSIKIPLLVSVGLLILAYISGSGSGWLLPASAGNNRAMGMQALFAWVAIVHTFMLLNDASVLFVCVPGMTMLALVSTTMADQEVLNAFLVFVTAATFLMVHENYLRTRNAQTLQQERSSQPMFVGQLMLAAACIVGALIMANFVKVPIEAIGQSIFSGTVTSLEDTQARQKQINTFAASVDEQTTLNLGMGPVTESDQQLLRVQASRGMYWRGTTYSTYTGHSFENHQQAETIKLTGEKISGSPTTPLHQMTPVYGSGAISEKYAYKLLPGVYDLPPGEMRDSHQEKQTVTVIGGIFSSLYGAATAREVTTSMTDLRANSAGTLFANVPAQANYEIVSQVPTQDEKILRKAPSTLRAIPEALREPYLQIPSGNEEEATRLKILVADVTKGLKNNYDRAEALRKYIAATCKYNLQVTAAPHDRDLVAWFLLEKKEGYCDSFAAAMTMLCRYAGIPARLASGFLSGDIDTESKDTYIVREKHKHVWTEVFFPHIGWVPFDATDGTVDISEHGANVRQTQTNFAKWLMSHGSLPLAVSVVLVVMLGYVVKTEVMDRFRVPRNAGADMASRPAANLQIIVAYAQMEALLARRGLPRMAHQTPDEYAASLSQQIGATLPAVSESAKELTTLYTQFRYGRNVATSGEVERAQQQAASIRENLQAVRERNLTPSA